MADSIMSRRRCPVLTLALRDAGGSVKVRGGVAGAGDAVVLPELRLVGPLRAADAAVHGGVVVVAGGALDCGATKRKKKKKKREPFVRSRVVVTEMAGETKTDDIMHWGQRIKNE